METIRQLDVKGKEAKLKEYVTTKERALNRLLNIRDLNTKLNEALRQARAPPTTIQPKYPNDRFSEDETSD